MDTHNPGRLGPAGRILCPASHGRTERDWSASQQRAEAARVWRNEYHGLLHLEHGGRSLPDASNQKIREIETGEEALFSHNGRYQIRRRSTQRQRGLNRQLTSYRESRSLTAICANSLQPLYRVPVRDRVPFGCAQGRRDDTHQEKQRDDGRRLQVRAESQQTAIAILHHELPLVPWHVAKSPSEFYALGGVLGIKCVGIFNEQVRVEQFVRVFVRVGGGRLGAAEMNHLLVARHDGVDRRILPCP